MEKYSPEERHQHIIEQLRSQNKVMASELAERLGTTEATIRRDLRHLAEQGLCKRIHGGAMSFAPASGTQQERLQRNSDEKQRLAGRALTVVKAHQLIFLDASSTNLILAGMLPTDKQLTVVTNSPLIALCLLEQNAVKVIQIGGELDPIVGGAVDNVAIQALSRFHFDICFLGVCAWSSEHGFSANNFQDAEFKRVAASRSSESVVMITQDKVDVFGRYPFLPSDQLGCLVSSDHSNALQAVFANATCQWITTQ
ncbi:DeoR/GlpR family DNA-binding transcription regulator [Alteromonas sp. AMM-1]|uniref:DeoR/GlpR family DNA-binding transcription regulator n=1 Tax=Alteromonas sp. AMM-1 TaxID=3394233 RepID=UPI0039A66843